MIGKVTSVKDNILYCTNNSSVGAFVGEVVYFSGSENTKAVDCKAVVFEITKYNIKSLLINGEQYSICINDSVYGTKKTVQVNFFFYVLGKIVLFIYYNFK